MLLTPLDIAAAMGHPEVVRVLLQQLGIDGCGGKTAGQGALILASSLPVGQNVNILTMLMDAGVVDPGKALGCAASSGRECAVKILLHRQAVAPGGGEYVDRCDPSPGLTPLLQSIYTCLPASPRVVRRLVDAGADTTLAPVVRSTRPPRTLAPVESTYPPLAFTNFCLRRKMVGGKHATEEQLDRLEAIRRLLWQVDAVHAVSWLWQSGVPLVDRTAEILGRTKTAPPSETPLTATLLVLRRRTRSRGVLLAALFRWAVM